MTREHPWDPSNAAAYLRIPGPDDDKYRRGVLGVLAGSDAFPGAAVLGVDAALRTGVGMVRYLGPERATLLVLGRRPEAVPADGRVQALVAGSGMDAAARDARVDDRIRRAWAENAAVVLDAGALDLARDAAGTATIITPHAGELSRLLGVDRHDIEADPDRSARRAAAAFGVVVLLKGADTIVAQPDGDLLRLPRASAWLASAGSGDVLAGILGALLAGASTERVPGSTELAALAASAAIIHARAAEIASDGGPLLALDLAEAVGPVIRELLAARTDGDASAD